MDKSPSAPCTAVASSAVVAPFVAFTWGTP